MDSANVVVGYGNLYTAPAGTAIPSLATLPTPTTWASAGFTASGYTDDGVQIEYQPTFKKIEVDESMSPVDIRLIGEMLTVKVKLAEATLLNLKNSIAGSTLTIGASSSVLTLGNPSNPDQGEIVLAFQGPAPTSVPNAPTARVFVVFRAKSTAAVTYHAQRKDKVIYNVSWEAMALSSASAGAQLSSITDFDDTGS